MFAIRARRKVANEKDFLEAVEKVIRQGQKFSVSPCPFHKTAFWLIYGEQSTSLYQVYN